MKHVLWILAGSWLCLSQLAHAQDRTITGTISGADDGQPIPGAVNPGNGGRVPRALPYPQQEVDANPNMVQRTNLSERPVFLDTRTTGPQ